MNRREAFKAFIAGLIPGAVLTEVSPAKAVIKPLYVINFDKIDDLEPLPESEIQRIRAEWENLNGPENYGRLIIMPPGGKLEVVK